MHTEFIVSARSRRRSQIFANCDFSAFSSPISFVNYLLHSKLAPSHEGAKSQANTQLADG